MSEPLRRGEIVLISDDGKLWDKREFIRQDGAFAICKSFHRERGKPIREIPWQYAKRQH